MDPTMITTAFTIDGQRIVRNLGVVRGIVVRSRSVFGSFAASIQTLFGGNITMWTQLCDRARTDAFNQMVQYAAALGANGIVGFRYDANEVAAGATEVLAYGTAVVFQPAT
jgi:uncharacterized protein YbjQ (UPF0145 family)